MVVVVEVSVVALVAQHCVASAHVRGFRRDRYISPTYTRIYEIY